MPDAPALGAFCALEGAPVAPSLSVDPLIRLSRGPKSMLPPLINDLSTSGIEALGPPMKDASKKIISSWRFTCKSLPLAYSSVLETVICACTPKILVSGTFASISRTTLIDCSPAISNNNASVPSIMPFNNEPNKDGSGSL